MTSSLYEKPLNYWLSSMTISLSCCIIGAAIQVREVQKRKNPEVIIPSKYLSIFSYWCIALGPFATIFGALSYLPALCIVADLLRQPTLYIQIAAMECYQLSRLYYCFSKDQVHSDKGYPQWIFWLLFSVLIMWLIASVVMNYSFFTRNCWLESDGTAMFEVDLTFLYSPPDWTHMIPHILYCSCELTTMALYWYKVHTLRLSICRNKNESALHDRIQSILHRVLILTYSYVVINGIMVMLDYGAMHAVRAGLIEINPFWIWPFSFNSLSVSYAMFLMQDHNTSEYVALLRCLTRYSWILYLWQSVCCCLGSMVKQQRRMLIDDIDERKVGKMVSAPTLRDYASPTYKNNTTGMELSVATKTVVPEHSLQRSNSRHS